LSGPLDRGRAFRLRNPGLVKIRKWWSMGEKQSHSVTPRHVERCGPWPGRRATRGWAIRATRLAVVALPLAAVLGYGPLPGRAWAQETPARIEAAPKTEAPGGAKLPDSVAESPQSTAEALSLRYRFIEKYSPTEDPNHPELLTQYRVGIEETQKTEREKPQGAPDRAEISRRTFYTERAARVGKLGEVTSAVRRYDSFKRTEPAPLHPPTPPLFERLTIWLKRQSGRKPLVLSLTPNRPLREFEFSEITKQLFVPQLTVLFPPTPRRVGDTWSIPRAAALCLVGEIPEPDDYELKGTLTEVRRGASGTGLTAVIDIAGQMNVSFGLSALKARIQFAFESSPVVPPATASAARSDAADDQTGKIRGQKDAGVVDARGRIIRVVMLWAVSDVLPDSDGRLKRTMTYQLNLGRKFDSTPDDAAGPKGPLAVPDPAPTPDESNSWLVYDDPGGKFHFFHPQSLLLSPRMIDPNAVEFVDQNPGSGQDVFILRLPPGNTDPEVDRKFRDAQQFQKEIDADWAKSKLETLRGTSGWLADAEWAPRKVYRKELGVKTPAAEDGAGGVQRIFIDNYLVLTSRNECFRAQSMTVRNDHVAFRTQAESMIKSFQFGPWNGKPTATPAGAVSSPTPPR
jgi:hypothetical protein